MSKNFEENWHCFKGGKSLICVDWYFKNEEEKLPKIGRSFNAVELFEQHDNQNTHSNSIYLRIWLQGWSIRLKLIKTHQK